MKRVYHRPRKAKLTPKPTPEFLALERERERARLAKMLGVPLPAAVKS